MVLKCDSMEEGEALCDLMARAARADELEAALREIRDNTTEPTMYWIASKALGDAAPPSVATHRKRR